MEYTPKQKIKKVVRRSTISKASVYFILSTIETEEKKIEKKSNTQGEKREEKKKKRRKENELLLSRGIN